MNTTSSGAVGFAPVGTFVKDLAQELGKSASTVAAYIKKHLPSALVKRKNANNRLANFALEQAVEAVRAHYKPNADNSLVQELERLRDENKRLRLLFVGDCEKTIEEIEATVESKVKSLQALTNESKRDTDVKLQEAEAFVEQVNKDTQEIWRQANEQEKQVPKVVAKLRAAQRTTRELIFKQEVEETNEKRASFGLPPLTLEEYKETINGKFAYQEAKTSALKDREIGSSKSRVIDIFSGRKTTS